MVGEAVLQVLQQRAANRSLINDKIIGSLSSSDQSKL
jgi:hypothetical protein